MEVYFDNSATTKVADEVIDIMAQVMREDYGNPSSKHMLGVNAEKYLKDARNIIAGILKANEKEIVFTSGGTESNNTAIIGAAMANMRKGRHIITTCFEHPSVLEPMKYLENYRCPDGKGFEVTYLPVDALGHISLEDLKQAIRPDTILVSTMFVNNEIGAVQDVAAIGQIVKKCNPACLFHVDAIQAFGKYLIYPRKMGIDLLSVSAHKFHGPKGVGFLYKKENVRILPQILGGGQQKGMRSGTDNVPGIAGMARAAQLAYQDLEGHVHRMETLKDELILGIRSLQDEPEQDAEKSTGKTTDRSRILINSREGSGSAPHIVSVTFYPVKSEVMLHALEDKGIYVSSGSACSSNKPGLSGTLQSIGLAPKEADCTIRFSFSRYNSREEIRYTLGQIGTCYGLLKKFVSR